MNIEQFWNKLKKKGEYKTQVSRKTINYNAYVAIIVYYAKILWLVFLSSISAKLGEFNNRRLANASVSIIEIVEHIGGRLNISGLKEIAVHKKPVVYVANHMSVLDTFLLPSLTLAFGDITYGFL
mmetsp:Transcript_11373/g.5721  ORF Transcript_11373/g.5721 Transcript_11373/m.5721 type:complete len:125 (+) Transcript_11373:1367-1741(+)